MTILKSMASEIHYCYTHRCNCRQRKIRKIEIQEDRWPFTFDTRKIIDDEYDAKIASLEMKNIELEKKVQDLCARLEILQQQLYFSPGMPGYIEARNNFVNLLVQQNPDSTDKI